eukprot:Lithocolla_globosa_v1_NODE_512_length_3866_cov_4.159013.p3 type:complete len:123 gc:universal NODE_512_length_3866_cov_4.159013:1520-1888(+)
MLEQGKQMVVLISRLAFNILVQRMPYARMRLVDLKVRMAGHVSVVLGILGMGKPVMKSTHVCITIVIEMPSVLILQKVLIPLVDALVNAILGFSELGKLGNVSILLPALYIPAMLMLHAKKL